MKYRFHISKKQALFKLLLYIGSIFISQFTFSQTGSCIDSLQTIQYGSPLFQVSSPFLVTATQDHGTVIFQNIPGPTSNQLLLFKTDQAGVPLWNKRIGLKSKSPWNNIRELDNGYLAVNSDPFLSPSGAISSFHIIVDSKGNFVWNCGYNNQEKD